MTTIGATITRKTRSGKGKIRTILLEFDGQVARVCREYDYLDYKITRYYQITPASRQRVERLPFR